MKVCVYVEGGGPSANSHTAEACRRGFRCFFEKVLRGLPRPKIVASGSRDEAYRDFCRSLRQNPDTFSILLVDSEDPVEAGKTALEHLHVRETNWPERIPDGHSFLMVQCMESWFLADLGALSAYYGDQFNPAALPSNARIEQIKKTDILEGLKRATSRSRTKGKYHKTRHGFDLLESIDPSKVRAASPHADALIVTLLDQLS